MKLILLPLLLLFSQAIFAQGVSDLATEDLKGKAKVVTETQYCDEGRKSPCMRTVDKYDLKGNLTEEIHNDYVLKIYSRKYLKYDTGSNGNITKLNEFNDTGMLVCTVDYKYDSGNRLMETDDHRSFGNKTVFYKSEYHYDAKGIKINEVNYSDGVLDHSTDYTYDSKGRISRTKSYDKNDTITMENDYNYLSDGQWVHREKHVGVTRTHIFRMVDSAGLVLEKTTYVGDYSKQITENYSSFDSHGNWLKQSVKGIENYFVTRKIEYYK